MLRACTTRTPAARHVFHALPLFPKSPFRPLRGYASASGSLMSIAVESTGRRATAHHSSEGFRWVTDEPVQWGGSNSAQGPLNTFLSALVGCTQFTLNAVSRAEKVPIGECKWHSSVQFDPNGQGVGFAAVKVVGEIETPVEQERLSRLGELVEKRCPIASTIHLSGIPFQTEFKKASN